MLQQWEALRKAVAMPPPPPSPPPHKASGELHISTPGSREQSGRRLSLGVVLTISLIAVFCLLSFYTGYSSFSTYSLNIFNPGDSSLFTTEGEGFEHSASRVAADQLYYDTLPREFFPSSPSYNATADKPNPSSSRRKPPPSPSSAVDKAVLAPAHARGGGFQPPSPGRFSPPSAPRSYPPPKKVTPQKASPASRVANPASSAESRDGFNHVQRPASSMAPSPALSPQSAGLLHAAQPVPPLTPASLPQPAHTPAPEIVPGVPAGGDSGTPKEGHSASGQPFSLASLLLPMSFSEKEPDVVKPADVDTKSTPSDGGYAFPGWWTEAWERSAVWEHRNTFVGDRPLYPQSCLTSNDTWEAYPFVEPRSYLPNSKNPCWSQVTDRGRELRCVPYFYLAGVAKCGTTDLAKRLRLHPEVFQGTMKEYHWWERLRFGNYDEDDLLEDDLDIEGGMTFKEYTDRISGEEIYDLREELGELGSSVRVFGDFSPSYLWDPRNWYVLEGNQNCSEPRFIVAQHIRHVYPQAKVILTFRHPTPRLYSRFLSRTTRTHELRKATAEDFHRYVVQGIALYTACFAQHSVRHCAYNISVYRDSMVRLVEGMYPVFMADWLRVWPRHQLLVLRYEDYGGQEGERLAQVFRFLQLAPLDSSAMEALLSFDKVNSGSREYEKLGPMLPETRAALDAFYQPFIHQFAQLLGDDRFLWKDVPH